MLFRSPLTTILVVMMICCGCGSSAPKASDEGVYEVGRLRITLDDGWYKQSGPDLPKSQARSSTWSREGIDHDRLFVTGGVDEGQPVFKVSDYPGLPVFQPNFSAKETADFVAKSLQAVLWDGSAIVTADKARERGFTGVPGFEFELSVDVPGGGSSRPSRQRS